MTAIKKIKINNFKGLKAFEGEVYGKDIYLIGRNESGKTSFIDAVWFNLTGKNIPPKPITAGEKKGLIEVTLEDGYVIRTKLNSTSKTPVSFEIENLNAEGEKDQFVTAPRTWLNKRLGIIDFDVNTFFAMSDAKQVEYFCKITGLDVSAIDVQIEEITESRKFDNKKLKELQVKTGFYKADDAEKDVIDVVQLSKDIAALEKTEEEKATLYNTVTDGVAEREAKVKYWERLKVQADAEINGGTYYTEEGEAVVIAPEKALAPNIANGYAWLDEPENKPVPNAALEKMKTDFENSEALNKTISEAKAFKAVDAEIVKVEKAIEEANDDLQKQRDAKAAVISEKISIEGLTYDTEKECFLFNGLPFDKTQINTASQLIAGLKIGASLLNEIKILKVDASLIDKENFKEVQAWAKAEGIELFVELVDREGGELKIQIDES